MSDDLVKRLREVSLEKRQEAWGRLDGGQDLTIGAMLAEETADRIVELEAYAGELEAVLESIKAKLATCEKYRGAYAECDRIGTQAVRDLEAKLAKAVEALELALELADNGLVDFSRYGLSCDADINKHYRTTLAALKGQDDE